jgi:hypothetical protein
MPIGAGQFEVVFQGTFSFFSLLFTLFSSRDLFWFFSRFSFFFWV